MSLQRSVNSCVRVLTQQVQPSRTRTRDKIWWHRNLHPNGPIKWTPNKMQANIFRLRKTKRLRATLDKIEPTKHDTMLEQYRVVKRSEFRTQMVGLHKAWAQLYPPQDEVIRADQARYDELEAERSNFISQLEQRVEVVEEEEEVERDLTKHWRQHIDIDPDLEVQNFLDTDLITEDTLDHHLAKMWLQGPFSESIIDFTTLRMRPDMPTYAVVDDEKKQLTSDPPDFRYPVPMTPKS